MSGVIQPPVDNYGPPLLTELARVVIATDRAVQEQLRWMSDVMNLARVQPLACREPEETDDEFRERLLKSAKGR